MSKPRAFTLIELMVTIAIIVVLVTIGLTVGPAIMRSNETNRTRTVLANALQIATEYDVTVSQVVNHLASPGNNQPFDWTQPRLYNSPAGLIDAPINRSDDLGPTPSPSFQARRDDFRVNSIERFVWATLRVSALKKLYATFPSNIVVDKDPPLATGPDRGYLEIVDAWGRKIVYAAKVDHNLDGDVLTFTDADDPDDDVDDFLPRSGSYLFASPGPDGKWGHAQATTFNIANVDDAGEILAYRTVTETPEETVSRLRQEASDNVYSDESLEVR